MSFFAVEVRKLSKVWPHPNADLLDLAVVDGMSYQFVVRKGQFKAGDKVVYFPIDSVWPQPLITRLGMEGKLSGKEKNRLKTVRLRQEISQGFVESVPALADVIGDPEVGADVTELLGVTKYEPPVIFSKAGNLLPLPRGVSVYDIEGCDRYGSVVEAFIRDRVPVWVSEKLEGSHFSITGTSDGDVKVASRRHTIEEIPEETHMFWEVARRMKLPEIAVEIAKKLNATQVTLHGEFLGPGVQGNIYKFKDAIVYLYDIYVDRNQENATYMNVKEMLDTFESYKLPVPPTLAIEVTLDQWLNGRSIQEASDGKSLLADTAREGVVIKPMEESYDAELKGRRILKQRGPKYLATSDF